MKSVEFAVSCEVAFDYLADPTNRPAWQSSLSRVVDVSGPVAIGQTWIDVTKPGLRPRMETTELVRPTKWTEIGTWRGVSATLTLDFSPSGSGCTVTPTMRLDARGPLALATRVATLLAPTAVAADLRRAAALLSPH